LAIVALLAACTDAPGTQRLPVGSPCQSAGQCGTDPYVCNANEPRGYCEKGCVTDGDCPADSLCSPAARSCRRRCKLPSDCRTVDGYSCVPLSTMTAVCESSVPMDGGLPSG
jgi:hypothetical protein